MSTTYSLKDEHGRTLWTHTVRRDIEAAARKAVRELGGCWTVTDDETILSLAQRDGRTVRLERLDAR